MVHKESNSVKLERLPVNLSEDPTTINLGEINKLEIKSSVGPFHLFPEYKIRYPENVTRALKNLYREYNRAFTPLIEANREWETDYQYAMSPDGVPVNSFVQIDMVGLPETFLEHCSNVSADELTETLRGHIFEYENSLAMYQLLEKVFSQNGHQSYFDERFRTSLDILRQIHNKPIALLAVTDQKHNAMRESEFGKMEGEELTDCEVMELSGFDKLFGPEEFRRHVAENNGQCEYLLYVRSSEPVAKLKDPRIVVSSELLADDMMRQVIKAYAITFNVDNPVWKIGDPRKINDTKAWMEYAGMAHVIHDARSIYSNEFINFVSENGLDIAAVVNGGGSPNTKKRLSDLFLDYGESGRRLLSEAFTYFLQNIGLDPNLVASGQTNIRFKPMQSSYGAYGHQFGPINRYRTYNAVANEIKLRGPYVAQPEMRIPQIMDQQTGQVYNIIDRNFMACVRGEIISMGGFRSLMPAESIEAKKGRNHGSKYTAWAEIR